MTRKSGKATRRKRRQLQRWRRDNVNHRTDDQRWSNEHYFHDLSPLLRLAAHIYAQFDELLDDGPADEPKPTLDDFVAEARVAPLRDMERLRSTRTKFLDKARRDHNEFVQRLERHWRSAFDLLEIFTWNSIEVMGDIDKRLERSGADDLFSEVMTRTAGRGMRIAREVAWLLRGGFPEAARARWRTLHEVAVMVTYIRSHGPNAAERVAAHELMQTLQFNEVGRRKEGGEALGEEFEEEQRLKADLLARFGPNFGARYGWAADVVGKKYPNFEDIERAAGMAGWRDAYSDATYATHGTSRPIHEESFRRHGRDVLGPTMNGLATPAIMTIRSLLQVDCAMLGVFVESPLDSIGDFQTGVILDAVAREAIDAWAAHEWPEWGLEHIPG